MHGGAASTPRNHFSGFRVTSGRLSQGARSRGRRRGVAPRCEGASFHDVDRVPVRLHARRRHHLHLDPARFHVRRDGHGQCRVRGIAETARDRDQGHLDVDRADAHHHPGQPVCPLRARRGAVVNITSDAATGAYEGWGGYGATKAALDQLSNVLAAEEPDLAVWWADPGEMNTSMLADAIGAEEAAAATDPAKVATALHDLIRTRPKSGRVTLQ